MADKSVRIPEPIYSRAAKKAKKDNMSLACLVRQALREYLAGR